MWKRFISAIRKLFSTAVTQDRGLSLPEGENIYDKASKKLIMLPPNKFQTLFSVVDTEGVLFAIVRDLQTNKICHIELNASVVPEDGRSFLCTALPPQYSGIALQLCSDYTSEETRTVDAQKKLFNRALPVLEFDNQPYYLPIGTCTPAQAEKHRSLLIAQNEERIANIENPTHPQAIKTCATLKKQCDDYVSALQM